MREHRVVLLPGDGIGPEVTSVARRCVDAAGEAVGYRVTWDEHAVGGAAMDAQGVPLPEATLDACRRADAVLLGAVGGPAWDDPRAAVRPEQALLGLRKGLGLFANLRPVVAHPALAGASPLRPEIREGADLLIVRELTGGLYFGRPQGHETLPDGTPAAVDTLRYSRPEVERVVDLAFRLAEGRRGHLTSVDKANVLASSRLWREVVVEVADRYRSVTVEHMLVDAAALALVADPRRFDVLVTENLFGDILSDEAAAVAGSMGLLASASVGSLGGEGRRFGLYEPVHGSAPDIAKRGVANPLATVASAAMMLRWSLAEPDAARAVETAVDRVLAGGPRTPDLGGDATTTDVERALLAHLAAATLTGTVQ
ncbi:MAG TPA: 3-isopropylmalate dehydrogenase [Candidatus Binatia bacterium]|nr:3-isopropylmalate dehydrogenase [Candidatus Binatia bacterium]